MDIENHEELRAYLVAQGRVGAGEELDVRTLAGGVSNRTVLVRRESGESWVLKQALAKLRVAVDWFSDPARVAREAAGMRALFELAPPGSITRLIFEDPRENLLAMAAVDEPHENWKTLLLAGRVDRGHVRQFGELLGAVHRRGHERRDELSLEFADQSFFETLRLEPYYRYTAAQLPRAAGALGSLIEDTLARRDTLVHGDYSPKNILVHAGRLVLLDHEVIHFGDGAFDLGFALAHLLSKARHLPQHVLEFTDAAHQFWRCYRAQLAHGRAGASAEPTDAPTFVSSLEERAVRHTAACLLARVAGRSPLEYLSPEERARQRDASLSLLLSPPRTIPEAIDASVARTRAP